MFFDPSLSLLLADVVLVAHVGIAAFVVVGLLVVVGGNLEHWGCTGFSSCSISSAPPWVFTGGYTVFALLVLATWWYFPPRFKRRVHGRVA